MEYINVDGVAVPIPPEVVSQGRDAVAAFVATIVSKPNKSDAPSARGE